MQDENRSVRIVQIDGKDAYLTNYLLDDDKIGYSVTDRHGIINTKRYRASLDYSLELIKLHEIYQQVYGENAFSFNLLGFDYTRHVCSLTFKYAVKEFNRLSSDTYFKHGADYRKAVFVDCVWVEKGELLGIQVKRPVKQSVDPELLGKWFKFEDGQYVSTDKFKTIMSAAKIREWIYKNGFYMDGIHFVRFMRSAGSARTGKCLFIDEKLYPLIHKWEMCGLDIKVGDECDLAGIESYISLTASSIIGAIEIKPENILLVDDYESVFKDVVVSVETKEDGHLTAVEKEVEISNSIWDGESLIDKSLMGAFSPYGFILLRNSFFKSAAFNCNLQKWFKDNGITDVKQLNGITKAKRIEQVLYVTTPSSIKYLKYGTFEDWLENISSVFGVVKYEKKPKFLNGKGVKVSYQLINTLAMSKNDVAEFLKPSLDYLYKLKNDIAVFRWHIHYKSQDKEEDMPVRTRNDVIYKLLGISDRFARTKLFDEFKRECLRAFVSDLKLGHVIVNGNYEVLAGNVMEFLNHIIGNFKGKSTLGIGNIHTKRFEYGKILLGCRSPHTSSGNVLLAHNVEDKEIDKYFNFTTEIVAVNSIGENILQRLSGADFDSDTMLLTDNDVLIRCASTYYNTFKVPTMNVDSRKKKRRYTEEDKASLDLFCDNDNIGIIVNLSQEINSIMWDRINKYGDWVGALDAYNDNCLLSILSTIAIDATKREYAIDYMEELRIIRAKYDFKDKDGRAIRPYFFAHVSRRKGYYDPQKKNYRHSASPMDYLQEIIQSRDKRGHSRGKRGVTRYNMTIGDILSDINIEDKPRLGYIDLVLAMVRDMDLKTKQLYQVKSDVVASSTEKRKMASIYFEDCVNGVRNMNLNNATMRKLLLEMDDPKNSDIKRKLWSIIFCSLSDRMSLLLRVAKEPIYTVQECRANETGDMQLYWLQFKYCSE